MQQTDVMPARADAVPIFTQLIDAVWNGRDLAALDALLAPGFVLHTTGGQRFDAAAYAAAVRAHHEGFEDLKVELVATLQQGDVVAARIVLAGTMTGPFGGHAATGRPMRVEGRPWVRVENGRIVELWSLMDDADMWAQLGLPPHTQ